MKEYIGLAMGFTAMAGGLGIAIYAVWLGGRAREMRHRERLAMIEKGLAPADSYEPAHGSWGLGEGYRHRRDGAIMMICVGIGLMMLFGLSSGNWKSVWIGGFITMFGVGNLTIALLNDRDQRIARRRTPPPGEPL
jgi:uncharacterized protein DUF6249